MPFKRDDIVIKYGADDSKLRKVTKRVKKDASSVAAKFKEVGKSIASGFGIGGALAGGGAITVLARMTRQLIALRNEAKALNTTVEGLSALQFAIGQTSEVSDQQFSTALQRLVKHIGQANRGSKESQKIFEELGLSWEYLASLDSDKAFLEVADAINRIDGEYKQASVAQKLFEDNWRSLLPTLRTNRQELEALIEKAYELGVPTTEAAEAADELARSIGLFNQNLQGLAYKYGPDAIGTLNWLITKFTDLNDNTRDGLLMTMVDLDEEIKKLTEVLERSGHKMDALQFERANAHLAEMKRRYLELADAISKSDDAASRARNNSDRPSVPSPGAVGGGASAGSGGRRGGSRSGKPTKSTGDLLVDNRQAAQRGEITNAEYRRRRRELIRNHKPEDIGVKLPTMGDFAEGGTAVIGSAGVLKLDSELQGVADRFIGKIDAGLEKKRRVDVEPRLLGVYENGQAVIEAADEEGERQ